MMSWLCKKGEGIIEVYLDKNLIGHYTLIKEPYCGICAHPDVSTDSCREPHAPDGFDNVCAMGIYYPKRLKKNDLLSEHILNLKRDRKFAIPLGLAMTIAVQEVYPDLLKSDVLTPVPSTTEEIAPRGYNQAMELAKVMAEKLTMPIVDALQKTKSMGLQGLDWAARQSAVSGLYVADQSSKKLIQDKNILLVDDVLTTGLTSCECARRLRTTGAKSVNAIVAGRTI